MKGLMVILALVSSVLAFIVFYAVIKKQLSKAYFLVSIYIALCVIAAFCFNHIGVFGLLGILGVFPLIKLLKTAKK